MCGAANGGTGVFMYIFVCVKRYNVVVVVPQNEYMHSSHVEFVCLCECLMSVHDVYIVLLLRHLNIYI